MHILLGWGLVQGVHHSDTAYAGQASARMPLLGSLVQAPVGHAEPAPPVAAEPEPAQQKPEPEAALSPVSRKPVPRSPGLDPGSETPQKGPAGDGADRQSQAADPFGDYLAAETLDMIPMPVTAPDSRNLNGMMLDVVGPVGVKLYVDAKGKIQQVIVDVPDKEQEAAEQSRTGFRNTAFVPGRLHGKAVASVLAIQIRVSDLLSVRRIN